MDEKLKNFSKQSEIIFLTLLTITALAFRLYGSDVPWFDDEPDSIAIANDISFDPATLRLPAYGTIHGPLPAYLIKLSMMLFGNNPMGARLIGILLGSLSVLIMYFFVKTGGSGIAAAFSSILLALDGTHIYRSKYAADDIYALFMEILALWLFFRWIFKNQYSFLVGTSIVLGLGFLCRETTAFFLIGFVLIVIFEQKNIPALEKKGFLTLVFLFIVITSPYILWLFNHEWIFLKMNEHVYGFTLIPKALFGLFVSFLNPSPRYEYEGHARVNLDIGFNSESFLMGMVLLILGVLSLKENKNRFIRMLALIGSVFLVISFFTKGAYPNHFKPIIFPMIALSALCMEQYWIKGKVFKITIICIFCLLFAETCYSMKKIKKNIPLYTFMDHSPLGAFNFNINQNIIGVRLIELATAYEPALIVLPSAAWDATGYYIAAQSTFKTLCNLKEQKYFDFFQRDFGKVLIVSFPDEDLKRILTWFQSNNFQINPLGKRTLFLKNDVSTEVVLTLCENKNTMAISSSSIKKFVFDIDTYSSKENGILALSRAFQQSGGRYPKKNPLPVPAR